MSRRTWPTRPTVAMVRPHRMCLSTWCSTLSSRCCCCCLCRRCCADAATVAYSPDLDFRFQGRPRAHQNCPVLCCTCISRRRFRRAVAVRALLLLLRGSALHCGRSDASKAKERKCSASLLKTTPALGEFLSVCHQQQRASTRGHTYIHGSSIRAALLSCPDNDESCAQAAVSREQRHQR